MHVSPRRHACRDSLSTVPLGLGLLRAGPHDEVLKLGTMGPTGVDFGLDLCGVTPIAPRRASRIA